MSGQRRVKCVSTSSSSLGSKGSSLEWMRPSEVMYSRTSESKTDVFTARPFGATMEEAMLSKYHECGTREESLSVDASLLVSHIYIYWQQDVPTTAQRRVRRASVACYINDLYHTILRRELMCKCRVYACINNEVDGM